MIFNRKKTLNNSYTFEEDCSIREEITQKIDNLLIQWNPYFLSDNYISEISLDDRKEKSKMIYNRLEKARMIVNLKNGISYKNDVRCRKLAEEILKNLDTINEVYHKGFIDVLSNASNTIICIAMDWQRID